MISVLVLGFGSGRGHDPGAGDTARSLGALVPGTVDGVIRDVQVLGPVDDPDLRKVADYAGCSLATGPLSTVLPRAAAAVRSPHVLALLAGTSFDRALLDEMAVTVTRHAAWLKGGMALKAVETHALRRLLPRSGPTVGILVPRDRLTALAPSSMPSLWRVLRPQRVFKTRAWISHD